MSYLSFVFFFSLVSELRAVYGSLRLSDWLNKPEIIEFEDNFDSLTRGMGWQGQQLTDINIDKEVIFVNIHVLLANRKSFFFSETKKKRLTILALTMLDYQASARKKRRFLPLLPKFKSSAKLCSCLIPTGASDVKKYCPADLHILSQWI